MFNIKPCQVFCLQEYCVSVSHICDRFYLVKCGVVSLSVAYVMGCIL